MSTPSHQERPQPVRPGDDPHEAKFSKPPGILRRLIPAMFSRQDAGREGRATLHVRRSGRNSIVRLLASVAGSVPLGSSRVAMSVNLERPMGEARDEVDLLTSARWMKSFGSWFETGVEVSG